MTAPGIQALTKAAGRQVVPDLADYDGVSTGWSEAEYRAQLVDTRSVAGFWEGEPGWVAFDSWPYNEVCVIVSGRVAIEDSNGALLEFGAGDAFTVPAGFRGVWHTLEPTKKIFVGVETDTSA
jgi:uncharacterized cupin superfamily protein